MIGIFPHHIKSQHGDVIKWKHFPRYWPFVRGIHRSPVNSPHKGQWRGALMFSLICAWISAWVNNREAGDLRRHQAQYDVIVMPVGALWKWILKIICLGHIGHIESKKHLLLYMALQWRHNEHDCVSNPQPHECLLKRLFRRWSKKTSKLRVTGLCAGTSPVTGEFPAQRLSNAENVPHSMTYPSAFPRTVSTVKSRWPIT